MLYDNDQQLAGCPQHGKMTGEGYLCFVRSNGRGILLSLRASIAACVIGLSWTGNDQTLEKVCRKVHVAKRKIVL